MYVLTFVNAQKGVTSIQASDLDGLNAKIVEMYQDGIIDPDVFDEGDTWDFYQITKNKLVPMLNFAMVAIPRFDLLT